ncbi:Gfo/Idh/MocA family protein [Algoriphagus sp. Y33]|uniref:Gfo/Idh/MocA family protein n=1 Tax=Algoriphagus sp. Y33 TaxID=2772483 RepID=UPI0017869EC7|nr:Gfo/Idh/MocA family oxidoreductase [Algoriphagus sp. Y33]
MKNFALIGASGYIAPRHMKAIMETGNTLAAAYDPYDGVGIMDSYFPESSFFVEFERFDRHIEKLKRQQKAVDIVSICSPNYLHDSHIRFGLRSGMDVICEKPIVLNPWNIDALEQIQRETGNTIYSVLQLRLHNSIKELKQKIENGPKDKIYDIDLTYLTSRGKWYYTSWKGDITKSGGIATNIGVHFFDMLIWIFGELKSQTVNVHTHDRACGVMDLERARVRWFLSINDQCLPEAAVKAGKRTYRSIIIEGEELEFSEGFTDLHTATYQDILNGGGFNITDTRAAIEVVHQIRHAETVGLNGEYHPLAKLPLVEHPFQVL